MILTINVGRSSIKYKLFQGEKEVKSAKIDRIGHDGLFGHMQAWEKLYQGLMADVKDIQSVVYKFPHGFRRYNNLIKLDVKKIDELKTEALKIPMSFGSAYDVAGVVFNVLPSAVHYAIFDDNFYHDLSQKMISYPLSQALCQKYNFYKFGSHGLSHQFALKKAQEQLGMIRTQRTISLHLGDSSSISAIKEGKCIETSFGYSSLQGLLGMSTPGDIDAGLFLSLLKMENTDELEAVLDSLGVAGVSGVSDDMRDILFLAGYKVDDDKYVPSPDLPMTEEFINNSRLAIEMYLDRILKYIGGYIAILGGLDTLIITGGIGYNSSEIRNMIINNLGFIKDFEILAIEPNEELEMRNEFEAMQSAVKKEI